MVRPVEEIGRHLLNLPCRRVESPDFWMLFFDIMPLITPSDIEPKAKISCLNPGEI
jgi:hypothetical protein